MKADAKKRVSRNVMSTLIVLLTLGVYADDYMVTVPQGETWSWSQAESATGGATSGKRLVKAGRGLLMGADLSSKGFSELVINEGVYEATALNQLPVVSAKSKLTVESGATLRIGFSLAQTSTTINVAVGGEGADGEGGAIVFTASSAMGAKYGPNWTLTSDTVFYAKGESRIVDFSCNAYGATDQHNIFYMNGHSLRFKGDATIPSGPSTNGPYIRFRAGPTIVQPGEIIFDNCRFSRYKDGGIRVWKSSSDHSNGTVPCIKLVNGARCNFACFNHAQFLSLVACIDAEAGTEIGDMGVSTSDTPGPCTINRLIGAPKLVGSTVPHIKSYQARVADLEAGHILTSDTNLNFTDGAFISVDDTSSFAKGTSYVIASGADSVVGSVLPGDDLANHGRRLDTAVDGNQVKASWTSERPSSSDEFPIFVPAGSTYAWVQATSGQDVAQAAGKKLVKLGRGVFSGDVSAAGSTELIVADGIYSVSSYTGLPLDGTVMKVTVEDGATFRAACDLGNLSASTHSLDLHLAGNGVFDGSNDLGAFCFWSDTGAANQWCKWTFDSDTLITIANTAGMANFSCNSLSRSDIWNVWRMNGHNLTLRCLNDKKGLFRFRSGPTIHNPGNITLDNARFSMYNAAHMHVADSLKIPVFKTVNGCVVNLANYSPTGSYLNKFVTTFDFGPGTVMDDITVHPTDTPGPTTIVNLIGSVTVSAAQSLTIQNLFTVRKDDLLAEPSRILQAESNLTFAKGCAVAVDDLTNVKLPAEGLTIAKCPHGLLSGLPVRTGEFSLKTETEDGYDCLKLLPKGGLLVIFK